MQRVLKLCGAVAVLCSVTFSVDGAPREPAADAEVAEATVEELPQRPMTLQNGYHPGLFPFNKGQPFVVDPNMSAIDFNTKPPNPEQRSDDYYDYDTSKLEEVPYDYKGDPIDRKDVVVPNAPRPNDIKPTGGSSFKNKQTDIYQFLNLPVKYSSSDKFPLMSSSYANTKIQGSGSSSSSSSLSNHKMPATSATAAAPTTSWYDTVKTTSTTFRPTTTTTTTARPTTSSTTTTTTTPSPPPPQPQEYEEESVYDYDYYHPQEPASVSDTAPVTASTTTTSTTTTTTASTTVAEHQSPPPSTTAAATSRPVVSSSVSSTSTSSSTTTTTSDNYDDPYDDDSPPATVLNKTTTTTTTVRPEIDSKLDGTSFADYDTIKPVVEAGEPHRPQQHELYGASGQQHFKPMPGNYQFANDKTYPLITNSKVPMTFTAHVSSGISLNQREPAAPAQQHQQQHHTSDSTVNKSPAPVSEPPSYKQQPNRPSPPEVQDSDGSADAATVLVHDGPKVVTPSSGSRPPSDTVINHQPLSTYSKYKPPPSRPSENDQFEAVSYYKVRPDAQPFPGAAVVGNRPPANLPPPIQGRPYQPEPPVMVKTSHPVDRPPKPTEPQAPVQTRPQQPYPSDVQQYVMKNKQPAAPQYVAPQSQPDTSKFKPPKHVINHFIKTQPNEDNKSYALQTSFSIGMDGGDRTAAETKPAQGIGQVLMVEDSGSSSSESIVNKTVQHIPASVAVVKPVNKATTSIPFVPPPRMAQKPPLQQQQYPRPQWENIAKPPTYYPPPPPPKRDGAPPPQRANLPNILPQFRPNAKVDAPPMMVPQSHSAATIERVQIPMDHLRPPPLPKPQFLKVDRNDEDVLDGETPMVDVPEKETRILQRTGPQPAKVTTLQMIQHGASSAPTKVRQEDTAKENNNPVHVIYAANAPLPPRPVDKLHADDSVLLDVRDRSDVPILKTKTAVNRPVKTDFPYQIVKPDDGQNMSSLEYKAYSPTKSDTTRPNDQELVPNLQDYVPVVTRSDPAANIVMPQKQITATLRTSIEDNHKTTEESGHKPQLQNFQIPFQPSMKLPENSNGWSVVRKSLIDNASEKVDETGGDAAASTEKFDPDNFKPQLVGGFMPINPLTEEAKDKKTAEQPERA